VREIEGIGGYANIVGGGVIGDGVVCGLNRFNGRTREGELDKGRERSRVVVCTLTLWGENDWS